MRKSVFFSLVAAFLVSSAGTGMADEVSDLKARMAVLEKRVEDLEKALKALEGKASPEQRRAKQQAQAQARMRRDADKFSQEERREIETLYQVANKQWRSPEAQASLKKLVEKYKNANRTGCAILYLGQMSQGEEQVKYLEQAIANHSDCYYGDGAQVGALARLFLGQVYLNDGHPQKAKALFDEIRQKYPDAIDHRGNPLIDQLPPAEK